MMRMRIADVAGQDDDIGLDLMEMSSRLGECSRPAAQVQIAEMNEAQRSVSPTYTAGSYTNTPDRSASHVRISELCKCR